MTSARCSECQGEEIEKRPKRRYTAGGYARRARTRAKLVVRVIRNNRCVCRIAIARLVDRSLAAGPVIL